VNRGSSVPSRGIERPLACSVFSVVVASGEERLWIVCPSYSDVEAFTLLRERILEVLRASPAHRARPVRFVVVDDTGGFDPETDCLRGYGDVTVISPPFNLGHQRAIVFGLRLVESAIDEADLVVTMDADGEDRPEDLPLLLEPLLEGSGDRRRLSVARRTKRTESIRFRVMYFFFLIMFRTLTGVTVRNGNYAAYRGWLARRMLLHPYFDLCYSSTLVSLDIPVTPVPLPRGTRYAGRSRMNLFRLLMHGIRMLTPFTDRIAIRAMTAFTAIFGIGVLLSLALVATEVFTSASIPGWTTATLLGILVLSLSAVGNSVVLFAVFSHSRGISMAGLEERYDRSARSAPSPSN
jgi:polyisoprenyl-phosphate glycosyltransferase